MGKFRKGLKIFIIIDLILLMIIVPLSLLNNSQTKKEKEKPIKSDDCIYKGQLCSLKQMYEGVEVKVEVKKDTYYVFNVIANSIDKMTLLMNENLEKNVDWHGELINLKGPQSSLNKLLNITNDWENVDIIQSYSYNDYGKVNYEKTCAEGNTHKDYDCTTNTYTNRGYNGLSINDGTLTLNFNLPITEDEIPSQQISYPEYQAKARMITIEEVNEFLNGTEYPKWLINGLKENKAFWTISSSTAKKTGYQQGAIAIANVDNKVSIESLYTMYGSQTDFEVGIRPVIEIYKTQKGE